MRPQNDLSKGNRWFLIAAIATLLVVVVNYLGFVSSYVMFVLMVGLCNVVLTVSLNLITGVTGQFSLGHAGFMAVGAYLSAYLSKMVFGLSSSGSGPVPSLLFFACLLIGAALAAGVAFLLGSIILRLTGDYLCIATLGFNQIVVVALNNLEIVGGSRGFYGIPKLSSLASLLILTWFSVIFISRYVNSVKGRNCEAILGDETAAESLGVDSFKVKLHSFVTGCFFAALAGGMLIHLLQLAHPTQYTFIKSIEILLMVVVGGMGNVAGSVISGIALTILPEALRFSQDLRLVLYPLILIIFISRDPSRYFYKIFPARTTGGSNVALLSVAELGIQFGGLKAVEDFSLSVDPGEIVAIIGPNGAGKTTVFNLVTGIYEPSRGQVLLGDVDVVGKKASEIANLGMVRTFQNIRLFKDLTVQKNVEIALHRLCGYSLVDAVVRSARYREDEREIREKALEILSIFQLENKASEKAKNLPYGQQRKLEIARALALSPKILLLDEPAAGMNQNEIISLAGLIRFVREQFSLSIILIEHQMGLVMSLSERIVVMNYGRIISHGTPESVRNDPKVIEAYLGRRRTA